jgi:hypothetical protein
VGYVVCPECGYRCGLGVCSEPGECPRCGVPLMLTAEFRALTDEDLREAARKQAERRQELARDLERIASPASQPG